MLAMCKKCGKEIEIHEVVVFDLDGDVEKLFKTWKVWDCEQFRLKDSDEEAYCKRYVLYYKPSRMKKVLKKLIDKGILEAMEY